MTTLDTPLPLIRPIALDGPRAARIVFAVVILATALWGRLVYLAAPFAGDGGIFAYMGQLTLSGGRFGDDIIDNKFPTVGLVTGVYWALFGNFWPGYVLLQFLMTLIAGAMLARATSIAFGDYTRFATFFGVVAMMNLNAAVGGGFQLETTFAFFGCISAACGLMAISQGDRRDALAAGLAAGYAALVKPTGAAPLAAFFLAAAVLLISKSTNRRQTAGLIAAAVVGAMFPLLAGFTYLHYSDQLSLIPEIARQISEYASHSTFEYTDLVQPALMLMFLLGAMFIRLWVYRRPAFRVRCDATTAAWAFVIAWFLIELIGIVMQRRMYGYHFIPLCAPTAVLFAVLPRRVTIGQLAGPLLLPLVLSCWRGSDVLADVTARPMNWIALTQWLEPRTLPGERIWRDNTPQVLINSDLRPASRLQLVFIFKNTDETPMRYAGVLIDDLRRHRPRYVITLSDIPAFLKLQTSDSRELVRIPARREQYLRAWGDIQTFIHERYRPVAVIGNEAIWERMEGAPR